MNPDLNVVPGPEGGMPALPDLNEVPPEEAIPARSWTERQHRWKKISEEVLFSKTRSLKACSAISSPPAHGQKEKICQRHKQLQCTPSRTSRATATMLQQQQEEKLAFQGQQRQELIAFKQNQRQTMLQEKQQYIVGQRQAFLNFRNVQKQDVVAHVNNYENMN